MTRVALALVATLAGGCVTPGGPGQNPDQPPNIVIIFTDDLGYGDLGCYGHPTIRTPHLDAMAAEGMKLTQFYVVSPVCSPSRAALLTGRYSIRSGVTWVLFPSSDGGIPDDEVTLAELLRDAGYATACVGKWHLGHRQRYLPTMHGFDRYFGIPYSNDMSFKTNPDNSRYNENSAPLPLMRGTEVIEGEPDQRLLTRRYTEEAVRFIREQSRAGRPFFLYLPHTMPHIPLFASDRFRGKSPRGLYGDVIEELDDSCGTILATIRQLGIERNTLVVFASDNGPWLSERLAGGSAGLLSGGKGTTWEGGMRVPAIFWWPGRIAPGATRAAFGTTMDLLPTCARLAGAPLPEGRPLDGVDLSPVLVSNAPGREPLLFYYYKEELHAVRKGPWKLHLKATPNPQKGGWSADALEPARLYHLLHDPSEWHDVAAENSEVVAELRAVIDEHHRTISRGELQR